jgi:hypothetical protein
MIFKAVKAKIYKIIQIKSLLKDNKIIIIIFISIWTNMRKIKKNKYCVIHTIKKVNNIIWIHIIKIEISHFIRRI